MKHAAQLILCLALLSGCQASGIRGYWNNVPLLEKDIRISEDRFADFAEAAAAADTRDALAAIDGLFDRLCRDTLAYYVYSDWIDGAFYNLYSPCRSAALYSKAVDRIITDAILQTDECAPFLQRKQWINFNQPGEKACVPGHPYFDQRTLVLVMDLGCPSCRSSLAKISSSPEWADCHHLAVGIGPGALATPPDWEFISSGNVKSVFDPDLTPIFFIVADDGTVEKGYTLAL